MPASAVANSVLRTESNDHRPIPRRVVFAGTLPPPVTGMTAMTAVIVEALAKRTTTTIFDWSPARPLAGWRWKMMRGWGVLKTLARLPVRGRAAGSVFYFAVSSGSGLYYDLLLAAMARLLGYRLVAHHHAYSYIDCRDWRAAALNRLVGADGAHAVHCMLMQQHYLAQYPSNARFLIVPPTIVSQRLEILPAAVRQEFTLGFLSNITLTKGIDEVLATFDRLMADGHAVRLILAGPCMGSKERNLIQEALRRWPGRIEYRGPVFGKEKAEFFADIDVFLFPTRYRNESWGIVLTEALSAGCPVIARSRACIPWIVRGGCGAVIEPRGDFIDAASSLISRWIESPESLEEARNSARQRSRELEDDALRELPAFVEQLVFLDRP